jgi:MoaA/NifB/PqqE/SkfB family radical SAM enzyme
MISHLPNPEVLWPHILTSPKCIHCYAKATPHKSENEFSTDEAKSFLEDIARYGCPVILFSGGEPFLRNDLFELIEYSDSLGLRPVISTNGTLITEDNARAAKKAGVKYIGVSLDGLKEINDNFRGVNGAFEKAISGMKNSLKAGIKTGLRFTITKHNQADLPGVLLKLKDIGVGRCCLYACIILITQDGVKTLWSMISHLPNPEVLWPHILTSPKCIIPKDSPLKHSLWVTTAMQDFYISL